MTSQTFTPMPMDDVDQLLNDNNAVGTWEQGSTGDVERWQFPRFKPNCPKCGTQCKADNNGMFRCPLGVSKADGCKNTKPVTMDINDLYLSRSGIGGHDSDVETLVDWLYAPRNVIGCILLLGDPGGGKTALLDAAVTHADRDMTTVLCTPDHTKDSLFLRFVGEDKGEVMTNGARSPYTLGPIPYAAKHGHVLYMDEVLLLVDGVKPLLYALADGRHYLPEGNVDGSPMEIHPQFRLVMSSNPLVRGASLPEPLASRAASTTLHIETAADLLTDLGIAEDIVAAWVGLGAANLWRPAVRELRMADYWLSKGVIDQALSAFLPEHCPESDREGVMTTVQGYIGGDLSKSGRLVVR